MGRNLTGKGLSEAEVDVLLDNDIEECIEHALDIFPGFHGIPEPVQHVIVNMLFQLGAAGFRKFRNFIAAVKFADWERAAAELLDSAAAKQAPARFERHSLAVKSVS